MESLIRQFGRILARERLTTVQDKLKFAGVKADAAVFVAVNAIAGFIFSVIVSLALYLWLGNIWYALLGLAGAGIVYFFLVTGIVGLFIDQREKFVEKVLPDALLLMASNLRSGISPDESLVLSAKTEFGFLSTNIKKAGQKIATGIPIEAAFKSVSDGIDSNLLSQTIKLVIEGINSGGQLASILEGTARDIKDNEIIRKEIRSMIFLYATFIFLAVGIISPVLYSVSLELSSILSKLSTALASGFLVEGSSSTIPIAASNISTEFLLVFAYINMTITCVFGSLMMALINRGNEKYGLRYMPFVLGLAILLFNVGRIVMKLFFGGIRVL